MSETEQVWYCPNCMQRQVFTFGGSMRDGTCNGCDYVSSLVALITCWEDLRRATIGKGEQE